MSGVGSKALGFVVSFVALMAFGLLCGQSYVGGIGFGVWRAGSGVRGVRCRSLGGCWGVRCGGGLFGVCSV